MSIPRHLISKLEDVFRGDKDVCRSPLRHLLKSNEAPSNSEVITIHALITDTEARIEELHRRFPVRDCASKVIESQVSQLLKIIEAHRALLSPVRYLPSEILEEIFLHYANNLNPRSAIYNTVTIARMPWRLGHVSHRWREVALSLPSLWDNLPKIDIPQPTRGRSYVRALICLIRRSGISPTLKLHIHAVVRASVRLGKVQKSLIKEIILRSERIEQLRIYINASAMLLFQGLKGRLPNLRILSLSSPCDSNFNIFEIAPALRQVTVEESWVYFSHGRVLLPWSQITHFEDESRRNVQFQIVPLSSLHSLTYLDIHKCMRCYDGPFPYRPITLPNLRTLMLDDCDCENLDLFFESLTIPAVEFVKMHCCAPLIPHLVSMFSGSRGPSRLQKLTFRTIPLQRGELSALLSLTPHLVELDIDLPPVDDLLNLIYGMGEVMLVPMLQGLHMLIPVIIAGTQTEHFHTLAQVLRELPESGSRKDSESSTIPLLEPRTRTSLVTLQFYFDSSVSGSRDWSSCFTPEEAKAIDMISRIIKLPLIFNHYFESSEIERLGCDHLVRMMVDLCDSEVINFTVRIFFWTLACRIFRLI